ncbi:MAG TPA: hypothetical protein VJ911_05065 [Cryomorphaceae bacterium]|nr:hypothetical protein [Cryomorphaceae bacterium]
MLGKATGLIILTTFCACFSFAQVSDTSSLSASTVVEKTENQYQEEEVEGLFELVKYLGKKLSSEIGNRMNLETSSDGNSKIVAEYKKVKIKLGPIKLERIEKQ